jgi:hypothetical protein
MERQDVGGADGAARVVQDTPRPVAGGTAGRNAAGKRKPGTVARAKRRARRIAGTSRPPGRPRRDEAATGASGEAHPEERPELVSAPAKARDRATDVELLARIVDSTTTIASWFLGKRWRFTKDECFRIASSALDAGDVVPVPKGALKLADRIIKPLALAIAVGSAVGPRMQADRAERSARKQQRAQAATAARFDVERHADRDAGYGPATVGDPLAAYRPPPDDDGTEQNREASVFDVPVPADIEIPGRNGQTILIPSPPASRE